MKILISNRGECALRIHRAARCLGAKTVAIYAHEDEHQPHLELADETLCVGPATLQASYLSISNILAAARITGADAIHPGYGFLSESWQMAEAVTDAGLTWIGPPPGAMKLLSDKAAARRYAQECGLPILQGSSSAHKCANRLQQEAEELGYPIMLKAARGGGGKGMRIIPRPEEWHATFDLCHNEAMQAYGEASFIVEHYLSAAKHIEAQVFVDAHGRSYILGYRDCSFQKKHQKIIEESFFPHTHGLHIDALETSIHGLLKSLSYRGLGTLEFLLTPEKKWYFIEMNMRMQVEHPVTECQTGFDLILSQLQSAFGEPIQFPEPTAYHAIECRVNLNSFAQGQHLSHLRWPGGPQVRIDSHLYPGIIIPPRYDSLLGKVICYDRERQHSIQRMQHALEECRLLGLDHNLEELKSYLARDDFLRNEHHTQS